MSTQQPQQPHSDGPSPITRVEMGLALALGFSVAAWFVGAGIWRLVG